MERTGRLGQGVPILDVMSVLCPTQRDQMVDEHGRPYFLCDTDMPLVRFEELLREGTDEVRLHLIAKLMRQAKPDDVFSFVELREIGEIWPRLEHRLGRTRAFWTWWMDHCVPEENLLSAPISITPLYLRTSRFRCFLLSSLRVFVPCLVVVGSSCCAPV